MKKIFTGICLCMFPLLSIAQNLTIKGNIKDGVNGEPIEYATVTLSTNDTAIVTGTTTNTDGSFGIEKVKSGSYKLKVSMVGYEPSEMELSQLSTNTDLGTIKLNEAAQRLEGVTVTASNTTTRVDRKLMFPTEREKKASTNGVDIIRQMAIPKVQYNALNDELKATDGGELQLRINGVIVNPEEIKALRPDDIIRVEYHDNPSLRYGNASVVLDYIVKRRESGGNINLNLMNSVNAGLGTDMISGKVNYKKSEFSASYRYKYQNFFHMWRDNLETYNYPDGSVLQRTEDGLPGRVKQDNQYAQATYNYQPNDKSTFNASLRYYSNMFPMIDYHSMLYNVNTPQNKVEMWDKNGRGGSGPSIDLYFEQKLPKNQTLFFNVVGRYNNQYSQRNYIERQNNTDITDILTRIDGDNYSLVGEGIYEKQFKAGVLSAGVKHTQGWTENQFSGNIPHISKMKQADSYIYGEWKGKTGKFTYAGGAGLSRNWYGQGNDKGYERYTLRPTFTLQYNISENQYIRLKGDGWNNTPSLTELSDVDQRIDSLQIQRGNPNLKPYTTYRIALNYEFKKSWFTGILSGNYAYSPDAVMEEKFVENNLFVKTFYNQPDYQQINGELTLRATPFDGKLNLQFTNGIDHFLSNGRNYNHRFTNWYYNLSATYQLDKFILSGEWFNSRNFFRGETLFGNGNLHIIGVTYKHEKFTVGAHVINPFVDNFSEHNENWSAHASYKQALRFKESSRLFFLTATYNLDFGRKYKSAGKRLQNEGSDSGISSAGK